MSTATIVSLPDQSTARIPRMNFMSKEKGILSWLLTGDHKRIAMLYLVSITFFFFIGGALAGLIRLELLTPQSDLMATDTYNKVFSMHGIIMIFFFLVPSVPATIGNFVIPMMVGAKDLALPKVNLLSWYLYMVGGILMIYTMCVGGVDTGWTFTTPLSTHYLNTNVASAATAVFVAGFSSILTGLNFIVTIHKMRCPGMTWFRLPLFVWSNYAGALLMVLGTPVLAITLVLVVLERTVHIGVFDPNYGGDPLLFQHLFWFYSHPAVYIMILPGMGVISETISTFSRKRVFGYTAVAFSSVAIAVFAFFVWAHHMFIMGISNYSMLVFSLLTMLVAVPSAIKIFNWAFTLYKGSITFETPMLYTFGFMGLFTIGGLTGVFLASSGTDIHLTETYFIVAHFHFVMVGGMLMAFLAGIHFWWPKIPAACIPRRFRSSLLSSPSSDSTSHFFRSSSSEPSVCRAATPPTPLSSRCSMYSPPPVPPSSALVTSCRSCTLLGPLSMARSPVTTPGRPPASSGRRSLRPSQKISPRSLSWITKRTTMNG